MYIQSIQSGEAQFLSGKPKSYEASDKSQLPFHRGTLARQTQKIIYEQNLLINKYVTLIKHILSLKLHNCCYF